MVRHTNVKSSRLPVLAGLLALASFLATAPLLAQGQTRTSAGAQANSVTSASGVARQYTVRSGDTLDRVIAQTLGSTPFSTPFLRDVFARMNPQALPQGAKGILLAGAVLQVPDACALRQAAFPGSATDCGDRAGPSAPPAGGMSAQERLEHEQRSWVRYP